jgi:RimJ/RimL family protein N-acetyltransferase
VASPDRLYRAAVVKPSRLQIRKIRPADAEAFAALNAALAADSKYSLITPDEAVFSIPRQQQIIRNIQDFDTISVFVAEADGALVGYVGATRGQYQRIRHCCVISIGVRGNWRRQGIATRLMETVEEWATQHSIWRLELSVAVDNTAAHRLYVKLGYQEEGRKRQSLQYGEDFMDEYIMAKIQNPQLN